MKTVDLFSPEAIPLFAAGGTDKGYVRERNEDAYLVEPPLFAVADGVGSCPAGDAASAIAVEVLNAALPRLDLAKSDPVRAQIFLRRLIQMANHHIWVSGRITERLRGISTTIVAAIITDDLRVVVAHAGDSRAYRWAAKTSTLVQLTYDHTINQRVSATILREGSDDLNEDKPVEIHRVLLGRALGASERVTVDTATFPLEDGDALLLCSDGLTNLIPNDRIARAFANHSKPQPIVEALIKAALGNGGRDNVTAVVCGVGEKYRPPV